MARQRKTLPARRQQANDDSLLIRSAESLGRMIGSLQRQLDAARRLTGSAPVNARGNGHAPVRERRGRIKSEEDDADAENRSFAFNGCAQSLERWARQDENNSPDVAFRATTRAAGAVTTRRHTHPHTTRLITFSPITAARQLPQRPDLRSATTVRRHPRVQP